MTAVSVRDVARRFRNGRGLGPVTLDIEDGERVALMGPNGAGKTTLLRLLATADRPGVGTVMWSGSAERQRARRHCGFASDTVAEEAALSVVQATHFWCSQWLPRTEVNSAVRAALIVFDLADVADEPVSALSFGMRRRLALAQSTAHNPRLLLLDEPTAGLDPAGVDALLRVLRQRSGDGLATVVAGNDCSFVATACERVVFLDAGCVIRDASPEALLAEVSSARHAELRVSADFDLSRLRVIDGVGTVQRVDGLVSVELLSDNALASVVAVADASASLRGLTLHAPDLSDSFRLLTGHALIEPAVAA